MIPQSARLLFLLIGLLIAGALVVRNGGSAPALVNSVGKALPPDAAPLSQQVLRVMSPEPRTLDATVNLYDTESTILPFETLLRRDENWEPVPAGADRYTASKDGKTWTFLLRRGARWSDGHPVTAHDYVYSFRRRLDPAEANPYAFFYYDIKNAQAINKGQIKDKAQLGVRAVDDLTLIIETEHPCPYLPHIVSFGDVYPVPRWQVEKYGRKWTEPGRCVSNSGFKLTEWVHGDRMVFVLDSNYNGPHKPFLEKVIHPFRYASTATILPYENDEVDIEGVDVTDLVRVERDPRLKRQLIRTPARSTWYLFFRTK
ncbi:MAG: hypothetical protein HY710_05655, partial [Candidatus Latescibacteria bacterium]|nr:hypothetical protein [Candidatus Latescibacterota bacterium]